MAVVTAELPEIDGCKVLTRTKAFLVPQGVLATLEHVLRDSHGNPVDLNTALDLDDGSLSTSTDAGPTAKLRIREAMADGGGREDPIWELDATIHSLSGGVLRADLLAGNVARAGVYELSWGVFLPTETAPRLADTALLSVERSLWGTGSTLRRRQGPPTINEIRMSLMDASGAENFYLGDTEFKAEQILSAIVRPIQYWNEALPPVAPFTTRTFPFRENWLGAIQGHLFEIAAHNFRRTHLPYGAGGISVDDRNKEREYLAAAQMKLGEWKAFVTNKKVAINLRGFIGVVDSPY